MCWGKLFQTDYEKEEYLNGHNSSKEKVFKFVWATTLPIWKDFPWLIQLVSIHRPIPYSSLLKAAGPRTRLEFCFQWPVCLKLSLYVVVVGKQGGLRIWAQWEVVGYLWIRPSVDVKISISQSSLFYFLAIRFRMALSCHIVSPWWAVSRLGNYKQQVCPILQFNF